MVDWVDVLRPLATPIASILIFLGGVYWQRHVEARRHEGALEREREAREAERRAHAEEVRREFQVRTLLELQDVLGELGREATAARHAYLMAEAGRQPNERDREPEERLMTTRRRLHVLSSRVDHEGLRDTVELAIAASALLEGARDETRAREANQRMRSAHELANERIGQLLKELGLLRSP